MNSSTAGWQSGGYTNLSRAHLIEILRDLNVATTRFNVALHDLGNNHMRHMPGESPLSRKWER